MGLSHQQPIFYSELSTISSSTLTNKYVTVPQSQDLVDFQTVLTDPETGYSKMIRSEKSHQLPFIPIYGYDTVKVESDGNPGVKFKTDASSTAVESSQLMITVLRAITFQLSRWLKRGL